MFTQTNNSTSTTGTVIDYGIFKVLDISGNRDAIKLAQSRRRNGTVSEYLDVKPGWYDREMLTKAGLLPKVDYWPL